MSQDTEAPEYNFGFPEDVLIQVRLNPKASYGWEIIATQILGEEGDPLGACSYEDQQSGFLPYVLKDMLEPLPEGFHVVEDVYADVYNGDGWTRDDDIKFNYHRVRPATDEEIKLL